MLPVGTVVSNIVLEYPVLPVGTLVCNIVLEYPVLPVGTVVSNILVSHLPVFGMEWLPNGIPENKAD